MSRPSQRLAGGIEAAWKKPCRRLRTQHRIPNQLRVLRHPEHIVWLKQMPAVRADHFRQNILRNLPPKAGHDLPGFFRRAGSGGGFAFLGVSFRRSGCLARYARFACQLSRQIAKLVGRMFAPADPATKVRRIFIRGQLRRRSLKQSSHHAADSISRRNRPEPNPVRHIRHVRRASAWVIEPTPPLRATFPRLKRPESTFRASPPANEVILVQHASEKHPAAISPNASFTPKRAIFHCGHESGPVSQQAANFTGDLADKELVSPRE